MSSLAKLFRLVKFRDIKNALLGTMIVVVGLALALVTLWAHNTQNPRVAGIAAAVSLVFVLIILIFVVPPLARSASAEASQMDLPFEVTVGGAVFFGLLVIVGFAAWNTGNNLLFLVLSFLLASLMVGFVFGHLCLNKLDVRMRFPERVFAESATPIFVKISNRKRIFPTFSVTAEVRGRTRERSMIADELAAILPEKLAEKLSRPPIVKHALDYFIYISRKGDTENRVEHVFPRRGRLIIKDFELSTKFPFGFFRHRRRLPAQGAEIVIFPRVEKVQPEIFENKLDAGKRVSARRGSGQDLLALRDYQPQDDLRHVDWKATARSRRIIVREYAAEDDKRITFVLDTRVLRGKESENKSLKERFDLSSRDDLNEGEKRFESAIGELASLISFYSEEQTETRLIIDEDSGDFGIGRQHLNADLKRLALISPRFIDHGKIQFEPEKFVDLFGGYENSYFYVFTSAPDVEIPNSIADYLRIVNY